MNDYLAIKIIQTSLMKNEQRNSRTHLRFLIMISVNLFSCSEKMFLLMNIWMIEKSLMKEHYLKKKSFIVT